MERIEYSNNYQNKKHKKNNGIKYLVVILFIILSFLVGAGVMYLYSSINPKIITNDRIISQNTVTEEAMEDAIDKVYDAVLCIEVLNNNGDLLSSGTGFVYDKDDKLIAKSAFDRQSLSNDNELKAREIILKMIEIIVKNSDYILLRNLIELITSKNIELKIILLKKNPKLFFKLK